MRSVAPPLHFRRQSFAHIGMRDGGFRREPLAAEAERQHAPLVSAQGEVAASENLGKHGGLGVDLAGRHDLSRADEIAVEFKVSTAYRLALAFEEATASEHAEMA